MRKVENSDVLRLIVVVGGSLVIIVALAVAGILFRSPDVELDQDVYPIGLEVNPNPFPGIGLNQQGRANFTFELEIFNSNQNPNLTVVVFVQPSLVENLTVQHCLETTQAAHADANEECALDEWHVQGGNYTVSVESGSSETLLVQALLVGSIAEPVSLHWRFWAEGVEAP